MKPILALVGLAVPAAAPAFPAEVASLETSSSASKMIVSGTHLLAASGGLDRPGRTGSTGGVGGLRRALRRGRPCRFPSGDAGSLTAA